MNSSMRQPSGVATTGRGRLGTDQRGMVLVVTLMVVLILAVLGAAFLTTSGTEHQIAKNDQEIVQALYVAEGGLQTALNQKNLGLAVSTPGTIGTPIIGEYTVTVTNVPPPTGQQKIVATGYIPTQAAPRAVKRIALLVCCTSPFQDALFGLNSVTVSASITSSYDCANGAYGATYTDSNGDVRTNIGSNGDVGSNGNITLSGSTVVNGDASTTAGHTVSGSSHVTETVTTNAAPVTMPDIACPAGGYTPSVPPLGSHSSYVAGDLRIKGGDSLTLTSPATYYFHDLEISPGTLTIATGGHVDIYIAGQLKFQGGSFVNSSGLPSNLSIWGCGTDTSAWTFSSGGTDAFLGLYAPNHSLTLSGGGDYYGSFIAEGTITESGGTNVRYDECLGRQPIGGKFVPGLGSWTELAL